MSVLPALEPVDHLDGRPPPRRPGDSGPRSRGRARARPYPAPPHGEPSLSIGTANDLQKADRTAAHGSGRRACAPDPPPPVLRSGQRLQPIELVAVAERD